MTVPLVGEPGPKEKEVDVEGLDPAPTASSGTPGAGPGPVIPPACVPRAFITFRDEGTVEEWFLQGQSPEVPVGEVCPVTDCPALNQDPVTDIRHATAPASRSSLRPTKSTSLSVGFCPLPQPWEPCPSPPEPL